MTHTRFAAWLTSVLYAWWRATAIGVFLVLVLSVLLVQWAWSQTAPRVAQFSTQFQAAAGRSLWSVMGEGVGGFVVGQSADVNRWLILGTDEVAGSGREDILTDTMMIASYRPRESTVHLMSLPRDIYLPSEGLKVNQLYQHGMGLDPQQPTRYVESVVSELLGVPIDGVLVIRLSDVEQVIDVIGGVAVEVPRTFEDNLYPRSGVDVSVETDPEVLFETVRFEAGWQHFDGATAIKYMRSRKSLDPVEGTDEARVRRQQQVIQALVASMSDPRVFTDPEVLGSLYRVYARSFAAQVSPYQLGMWSRSVADARALPELRSVTIPVTELALPPDDTTLFVHPPIEKYRQWAYEAVDPSGEQLRQFVQAQGL